MKDKVIYIPKDLQDSIDTLVGMLTDAHHLAFKNGTEKIWKNNIIS